MAGTRSCRSGREIRRAPAVAARANSGFVYAWVADTAGTPPELIRYDSTLHPAARIKLVGAGEPEMSFCLSADGRTLALSPRGLKPIELRRADTLTTEQTLRAGSEGAGDWLVALTGGANGWWTVATEGERGSISVAHFSRHGRLLRNWQSDNPSYVMSPGGRFIYMPGDSDLLVIDTTRATTRRIRYNWRRPLPEQYLPKPSHPGEPIHLYVSAVTLTPDGHTLILTEYLNGDPET